PANDGIFAVLPKIVDILRVHAIFLSFDEGIDDPLHDIEELIVTLSYGRAERLLGDELRQNDVIFRILGYGSTCGGQARSVRRIDVAASGEVGSIHLVELLDHHRLEFHAIGSEEVRQVELGRGARLHADSRTLKLHRTGHTKVLVHHEALPVMEGRRRTGQAERGIPGQGPGGYTGRKVHFAGLQHGEALLGRGGNEVHSFRIAENGGSYGTADIGIKPGPVTFTVRVAEAGKSGGNAAIKLAALQYFIQGALGSGRKGGASDSRHRS